VRTGFWIITKEMFVESPILGVGAANHFAKMKDTVDLKLPYLSANKNFDHFHNQYWDFLTQFGIIGLSIFLYFLFTILRVKIINQEVELIKIATMSIFILGFFVDNVFRYNSTMMLFSFVVGIVLAQNEYESRKKSSSNFHAINNS
jgi:O-antigen ligase